MELNEMNRNINTIIGSSVYNRTLKANQRLNGIEDFMNLNQTEDLLYFTHSDHLGSSIFITVRQAHCTADASGEAVQHLQYLPFGESFVSQTSSSWQTRYSFSGKEKDVETGYSYFGARYYDSDLSIWLSVDPLADKYPSMSAFMYVAGNPVMLVDPDGRTVVGTDGEAVTYTKDDKGNVTWSENASDDTKEIGNAMLKTDAGEEAFNKMQKQDTKFTLEINRTDFSSNGQLGQTFPDKDENGDYKMYKGEYESVKIVVYEKNVNLDRAEGSGKRFEGAGWEESLGAVGTHEVYHSDWRQIDLDNKTPTEENQNPRRNLPINKELTYRRQYQATHPDALEKCKKGMKIYDEKGYKGK
jgi:RHS repeat-associated protein